MDGRYHPNWKRTTGSNVSKRVFDLMQDAANDPHTGAIRELAHAATRTRRRLRVSEMASRIALLGAVPAVFAAASLVAIKLGWAHGSSWPVTVGGIIALAVPLGGALHAAVRQRPELEGALVLDRHHGFSGRVSNALVFS